MKYATILKTDLQVSRICFGTNRFGTIITEKEAFRLLDAFRESGGTFIDTAHVYANWIAGAPKSASEKTIGRWLKKTGIRQKMIIASKGGHPELATPQIGRLSKKELTKDIDETLSYLQTDFIDLFWLHRDDPTVPVSDIMERLNEKKKEGKIRYYGCSNWKVPRMEEAQNYCERHGMEGFVASQVMWSAAIPNKAALSDPERLVVFNKEEYSFHNRTKMTVIPYSSQANGFYSKLTRNGINGISETDRNAYFNEENLRRFNLLQQLALRYNVPIAEVVLSYLISQPILTIPVIGCRTIEQLEESVKAVRLTLAPEEIEAIYQGL